MTGKPCTCCIERARAEALIAALLTATGATVAGDVLTLPAHEGRRVELSRLARAALPTLEDQ